MIILDGLTETCHRCGSNNLSIINIDIECNTLVVWCNNCDEQTLEDKLNLDKIKEFQFHT